MYYVYILRNTRTGSLYKGFSRNLEVRLSDHKKGLSYWTRRLHGNFELIWYSAFVSIDTALAFEKYLKTASGIAFSRKRLISLKTITSVRAMNAKHDLPFVASTVVEAKNGPR